MGSFSCVDEFDEVAFEHAEPFLTQELQKVNDVISSCLFQNKSLYFSFFFTHFPPRFSSIVLISPFLYFLKLSRKAFLLFIEKIDYFRFHHSLAAALCGGFANKCVEVTFWHSLRNGCKSFNQNVLGSIEAVDFSVKLTLEIECKLVAGFRLSEGKGQRLILATANKGVFVCCVIVATTE